MHIKHTSNLKITKNYSPASYSAICGPIIMHRTVAHTITALIIVPKMQASCCCCCGVRQLPQLLSLSLSGDKSFEPRNRRRTLIICKNAKCGPKLLKFNLFLTSTYKFFQSFFFFLLAAPWGILSCMFDAAILCCAANKETGLIHNSRQFCILHYIPPLPLFSFPLAVLSWQFSVSHSHSHSFSPSLSLPHNNCQFSSSKCRRTSL